MKSNKELKQIYESFDLTEFNKAYQKEYVIYKSFENIAREEMSKHDVIMKNLAKLIEDEVVEIAKNLKVYLDENNENLDDDDIIEMEYDGFKYDSYYGIGFYVEFIEPWTERALEWDVPRKTKRIFIKDLKDLEKIDDSVYTMQDEYIRLDNICSKTYSELMNKKHTLFDTKFNELLHKISNRLFFDSFAGSECYILTYIDRPENSFDISCAYKWAIRINK